MNKIEKKLKKNLQRSFLSSIIPYIALILIFLFFTSIAPDRFASRTNLLVIVQQASVIAIVAFGLTFIIIAGSIDLSVSSVVALTGMIAASVAENNSPTMAILAGLLTGMLTGLFNGIAFAVLKVPSFVVTLGMLTIARGLTILYSGSQPIRIFESYEMLGQRPGILIVLGIALLISFILLNLTTFGKYTLAIGGEERVAKLSGVPITRMKILLFILAGTFAGLGGIVLSARVGAATPNAATGFELNAIAAVVLGGTPMTGGMGNVTNTVIGALIITSLINGMVILGIRPELQLIIQGLVLIFAVLISIDRKKIGEIK